MAHHHNQHGAHDLRELETKLHEHDTWFRHDAAEPHHQAGHGETHGVKIIVFLVVVIVIVFITIGGLMTYYKMAEQAEVVRKHDLRTDEFGAGATRALREEWNRKLATPGWVDATHGVVRLPLDQASKMVIAEYRSKPAH